MTLRLDDDESDALRAASRAGGSVSWADVASRPPLYTGSRSEIEEAICASDRDWAGEGPG
jgi:hypothetical protein